MKYYFAAEMGVVAGMTGAILSVPRLGGPMVVIPVVVFAWVLLQLVSSVAFCNAIHSGSITVRTVSSGDKETYAVAERASPGWLVMRHVWTYNLLQNAETSGASASVVNK